MITFSYLRYRNLSSPKLLCFCGPLWSQVCRRRLTSCRQSLAVEARNYSTVTGAQPKWPSLVLFFTVGFLGSVGFGLVNQNRAASATDPTTFKSFTLESKERVSSTSSIFTLSPTTRDIGAGTYEEAWQKGVWSVQIKQPQLQIARAYTPLPPPGNDEAYRTSGRLSFLIRHDPRGEVSGYLHKLPLGATIDLRGPQVEYAIPEDVTEVLFLAGGTGIAPALQVAHSLYEARKGRGVAPKLHVLWANRRREDCEGGINDTSSRSSSGLNLWTKFFSPKVESAVKPTTVGQSDLSPMVLRLETLKKFQSDLVSVEYFVDEEQTVISKAVLKDVLQPSVATSKERPSERKLILVSGPDGFIEHFAGSKAWQNGKEVQGRLKGLLSQIDHSQWEVWKL